MLVYRRVVQLLSILNWSTAARWTPQTHIGCPAWARLRCTLSSLTWPRGGLPTGFPCCFPAGTSHIYIYIQKYIWLVVWTPLKNISQLGWLLPIYGKIKNVPNHQPGILYIYIYMHGLVQMPSMLQWNLVFQWIVLYCLPISTWLQASKRGDRGGTSRALAVVYSLHLFTLCYSNLAIESPSYPSSRRSPLNKYWHMKQNGLPTARFD